MSVKTADNSLDHLYPPMRERLLETLAEAEHVLGQPFTVVETYRSPERQLYLYAQGRTRPGPVITWTTKPTRHGSAMAADVVPKRTGYKTPYSSWLKYRQVYQKHGLEGSAWAKGDYGHTQWPLDDAKAYAAARAWVRAGFPKTTLPPKPPPEIPVYVNGELIKDADAILKGGRVSLWVRPVTDELGVVIAETKPDSALLVEDEQQVRVPLVMHGGRGFVEARSLKPFTTVLKFEDGKLYLEG